MNKSEQPISDSKIKKVGSIVWKNALNYGTHCIGLLVLYIGLSLSFQLFYGLKPLYATAISNILCVILCGSVYIKNRLTGVPSFQVHNVLTSKAIILCSAYMVAMTLFILMFFNWSLRHVKDVGMENRASTVADITIATYFWFSIILAPIAEEVMMRLFLYNSLKRTSHWIAAMFVSSFAFAILHNTIAHSVLALCFGIILTLMYEYTGSIGIIIIYHMLYNFISLFFKAPEALLNSSVFMIICAIIFVSVLLAQIIVMNFQMSKVNYQDT